MARLSGTVADRYRVLERIGAGAFGEDAWDSAGGGETWYFDRTGEYSI